MSNANVQSFNDDADYAAWVTEHPNGYVVNANVPPVPSYLILHRASCRMITGQPWKGDSWTEGTASKTGATRKDALALWAEREVRGGELRPCQICQP